MNRIPLLILTVALTGCFSVRTTSGDPQTWSQEVTHTDKTWSHHVLWGLARAKRIDTAAICGDRPVLETRSHLGPVGVLASAVTLGLWTPLRVRVTCGTAPAPFAPVAYAPAPPPRAQPLAVPATTPAPPAATPGVTVVEEGGRTIIILAD